MSALSSILDALQVVPVSRSVVAPADVQQIHSSLTVLLSATSALPFNKESSSDVCKVFTKCLGVAEKLCGMPEDIHKCHGLDLVAVALQNCPRTLFLSKVSDVCSLSNALARGNSPSVACAAASLLVEVLKRLHTFMAAQGVKAVAAQPVAQIVLTCLHLLRSSGVTVTRGLDLLAALLDCMPQAAKSQYQAASKVCHAIVADVQLPRRDRLRAMQVLAALPASQNTPEARSEHLHGLLSTIHIALSLIPAPATDSQAARAARDALGDTPQGHWAACTLIPPANTPSHHMPPSQRLDTVTLLLECLRETLQRRCVPPVRIPVSPALLLASRLVAQRPLHIPPSTEQYTPAERAELLLMGAPLLKAGLQLLQRLLTFKEQVMPMATAINRLLCELLLEASTPHRLPEDIRAALYATVAAAMRTFGLPAVELISETLVPCAWAEFETPEGERTDAGAAVKPAVPDRKKSRQERKKKRKAGDDGGSLGGFREGPDSVSAAVEHAHRPSNLASVSAAQATVLHCVEAVHDIASGGLPAQLQVDIDVFTISALESVCWCKHLLATDPRIHDAAGVAQIKLAATQAAAAMCRSGYRRQLPMKDRLASLLKDSAADPDTQALQAQALEALEVVDKVLALAREAVQGGENHESGHAQKNGVQGVLPVAINCTDARLHGHSSKRQRLEEDEHDEGLCQRVAAVMRRGVLLARGLCTGAGSDAAASDDVAEDAALQDCSTEQRGVLANAGSSGDERSGWPIRTGIIRAVSRGREAQKRWEEAGAGHDSSQGQGTGNGVSDSGSRGHAEVTGASRQLCLATASQAAVHGVLDQQLQDHTTGDVGGNTATTGTAGAEHAHCGLQPQSSLEALPVVAVATGGGPIEEEVGNDVEMHGADAAAAALHEQVQHESHAKDAEDGALGKKGGSSAGQDESEKEVGDMADSDSIPDIDSGSDDEEQNL